MTRDPATLAEDALVLLDTGRVGMARATLAALPEMIRGPASTISRINDHAASVTASFQEEFNRTQTEFLRLQAEQRSLTVEIGRQHRVLEELKASIRRRKREFDALGQPRGLKPFERLAEALKAGRITQETVCKVLSLDRCQVERLVQGQATVGPTSWKRLWRAIEAAGEQP